MNAINRTLSQQEAAWEQVYSPSVRDSLSGWVHFTKDLHPKCRWRSRNGACNCGILTVNTVAARTTKYFIRAMAGLMKNTGQNGQIWMHAFWEDGDGDIGVSGPDSSPAGWCWRHGPGRRSWSASPGPRRRAQNGPAVSSAARVWS